MSEATEEECVILRGIRGADSEFVSKGELRTLGGLFYRIHWNGHKRKVEEMHAALFDENLGIVPALRDLRTLRRWICLAAAFCASLVLGGITVLAKLSELHWWPFQ